MEIKNKEINKETKKSFVVDIPEGSSQIDKVYGKVDNLESILKNAQKDEELHKK